MSNGYVKLYRSIENWEWYADNNTLKLFIHCLIKANHKPKKWFGKTIESGSFITSIEKLSHETHMSPMTVRTSMNRLKSTYEITSESTNRFTQINVVKWADYQLCDDDDNKQINEPLNKQITNKQQTDNKQITTNNNDKNDKNIKNERSKEERVGRFTPPSIIEVDSFIRENNYHIQAERFISHYESNGWMVGKNRMKDWKAAVRSWNAREGQRTSNKRIEVIPDWMNETKGVPQNNDESIDIQSLAEKLRNL